MTEKTKSLWIKILTSITFLMMIVANALANIIPLGGVNTGEVSDSYKNLFAPAPMTFAIWIVIYLLLALFTVYQTGIIKNEEDEDKKRLVKKVSLVFCVSSVINTGWIFAWHYDLIGLSLILMTSLLTLLIVIMLEIIKFKLTGREKVFLRLPFSIYFGWITVASIANIVTFLVSVNWDGYGLSDAFWMVVVLAVGAVIGAIAICRYKDFIYGMVLIWAYSGILLKHLSANGYSGEYTQVIVATSISIALFAAANIVVLVKNNSQKE